MGKINFVLHAVKTLKPSFLSCYLMLSDPCHTKLLIIAQSRSFTQLSHQEKQLRTSTIFSFPGPTLDASLIKSYIHTQSRPLTHPSLPERKQEEHTSLTGMENTGEEMTSKRAREPDSTLSPPAKKFHNTSSQSTTVDECESSLLPSPSTHTPSTEEKTDITKDSVTSSAILLIPKNTENEQASLERTANKYEDGREHNEQMSVERTPDKSEEGRDHERDEEMSVKITDKSEEGRYVMRGLENKDRTEVNVGEVTNKSRSSEMDVELSAAETEVIEMETNQKNMKPQTTSNLKENNSIDASGSEETEKPSPREIKTEDQEDLDSQTTSNQALEVSITTKENDSIDTSGGQETEKPLMKEIKMAEQENLDSQTTIKQSPETNLNTNVSPTPPGLDKEGSTLITSSTEDTRTSNHKGEKDHQEKWRNKKGQERKYGSGEKKKPRPNYFVGVQISNPEIHRAILKVQEDLIACDESLSRALVDVATSHITLLVAHLSNQEAIDVAIAALEESAARIKEEITANPINITFSGVKTFSQQVVFADVCKDIHHQRLLAMAKCIRGVFQEYEVCMPDTRDLHPHLTIAKLSKAPPTRGKRPPLRRINPSYYSQHSDLYFGTQTLASIQLLSMNKTKDESRYYHSDKQLLFDIKIEEDKDHSLCCFPRRPILSLPPQRTYTTSTGESDTRSPWFLSVAGVATLVAGALVLGFAIARLRR